MCISALHNQLTSELSQATFEESTASVHARRRIQTWEHGGKRRETRTTGERSEYSSRFFMLDLFNEYWMP